MAHFSVPNKQVACTTLGKYRNIVLKGTNFKTAEQKGSLLELAVVYGNDSYHPGDRVFIRGDAMTLPWSKEEYQVDGGPQFILVPEDRIQLRIEVATYENTV